MRSGDLDQWIAQPHRRFNPLTGHWVLVSPHRMQRPWLGERTESQPNEKIQYDPACYLCPGNQRANGHQNPQYTGPFVFDNDFPALLPTASGEFNNSDLLVAKSERGISRVICFTGRHDLSIPTMDLESTSAVVRVWCDQTAELYALPFIHAVQIFENRGAMMGASNPHPHCQVWATESIPTQVRLEDEQQNRFSEHRGVCLLCSYRMLESNRERLIFENDAFLCVVPFWAEWPFETLVIPKRHCGLLTELTPMEQEALAATLQRITRAYELLFQAPFPYTMGFHQRPKGAKAPIEAWHLHAHFFPPLLRSATIRKYMVGFELLGEPQRDLTPEAAAARLRELIAW